MTTERVRQKAQALVDSAEASGVTGNGVTDRVTKDTRVEERIVVEAAAQAQAIIEMKQRASLRELRDVRDALMAALRAQITDPRALQN